MANHEGNVMIDFFGDRSVMFVGEISAVSELRFKTWWGRRRLCKKLREESGTDSLDGTLCEALSVCISQRGPYDLETQQSAFERASLGPQSKWDSAGCDCSDFSLLLSDNCIKTLIISSALKRIKWIWMCWPQSKHNHYLRVFWYVNDHKELTDHSSAADFRGAADAQPRRVLKVQEPYVSSTVFRLFVEGEDTCTLDSPQLHALTACGFNSSNPLIIITHGWSVRSTPTLSTLHWLEPVHTKHGTVQKHEI